MGSNEQEKSGLEHIHTLMHVLIEGIAAGIYVSIEDAQRDAQEYLAMEKAVKKLSQWDKNSSVEELASIFNGISNSMKKKEEEREEKEEWASINAMPSLPTENGELDVK